jgi:hypothetical protein
MLGAICLLPLLAARSFSTIPALPSSAGAAGIAWQVKGTWQLDGKGAPLKNGDAVPPASLLQPDATATQHTVIILLPDGQRILYECFTPEDCARGFRVPLLHHTPDTFAVDMLARIRAILLRGSRGFSSAANIQPPVGSPRDEFLGVIGPDHLVQLGGLASKLANGKYTYDLFPLDPARPAQSRLAGEKTAPTLSIAVPSPGLYVVAVTDELNMPRMHLFVAAVSPAQQESMTRSFRDAKVMMQQWNEDFYGWPTHEFQWAFLESLMAGEGSFKVNPVSAVAPASLPARSPGAKTVTAEPTFTPPAGTLPGDADISLKCSTPQATIHFTVDTSQPMSASPVYGAPIVIMSSGLTIKAFASSPGRRDSAVVTGIFRIRKQAAATH